MSLKRKFILRHVGLLCGLCVLGSASMWGMMKLRASLSRAVYVYEQLNAIEPAEVELARIEGGLQNGAPDANDPGIGAQIDSVIEKLEGFTAAREDTSGNAAPQSYSQQRLAAAGVLARLKSIRTSLDFGELSRAASWRDEVRAALVALHDVVHSCDQLVRSAQESAGHDVRVTMTIITVLSALILVIAATMSFLHYRALILPLQKLRRGVKHIAGGDFAQRCDEGGDREFAELAKEFNRMAAELNEFYQRLEAKVQEASKQLVRSERLASVGFLAAGVAHEINNPLSIISGYAELSLRGLGRAPREPKSIEEAEQALSVIREEAFRCKKITQRLLSLARGGGDGGENQTFSLANVAEDVTALLAGLKNYRDRRVELKLDRAEPLDVTGRPEEMKQVILNLAVNALEASPRCTGEVQIDGRRRGPWVELCVIDNGRGMPPEVLDRVFEPFFTARPGYGSDAGKRREHGTGLGLSITHAIVESHGGEIHAESEGVGRGSKFIVRLPAAVSTEMSSSRN